MSYPECWGSGSGRIRTLLPEPEILAKIRNQIPDLGLTAWIRNRVNFKKKQNFDGG
jgi:hypothetical protein